MTNNWSDIGNATLVIAMGANPSENHPACMNHINRARQGLVGGSKTLYDRAGKSYVSNKPQAELIVVDPRKTRTALQADKYVRVRPGTDIAFINGMLNYILGVSGATGLKATGNENKWTRFKAYHEATATRTGGFIDAAGTKRDVETPKYSDASFLVNTTSKDDYVRTNETLIVGWDPANLSGTITLPTGTTAVSVTGGTGGPWVAGVDYSFDTGTRVLTPLSAGIVAAGKVSVACTGISFTQMSAVNGGRVTPVIDTTGADTVFNRLKAHVAPYTLDVVADICGCTTDEIKYVADKIIANSQCSSVVNDADGFSSTVKDPRKDGYRATTFLYAMGLTQHTCGSENCNSLAVIQTLMGNMGRAGGGVNALRGIHNVQGSTDMGLLYHLIPGYSGNPSGTFDAYMNGLFGNRLNSTTAYTFTSGGLQQKGFWNMTRAFFSDTSFRGLWATNDVAAGEEETVTALNDDTAVTNALYALWPKGNGDHHIKMFRKMQPSYTAADKITAAVAWGQNPAVTEPNQGAVRSGLKELNLLVVADIFENETASCDRKDTGVTFLIPAAPYPEQSGTATNSGRVLQWRHEARKPAGNSRSDMELLLRFAYALDKNGCFEHIAAKWRSMTGYPCTSWVSATTQPGEVYAKLYGGQYGWTPGGTFNCYDSAKRVYKQMNAPLDQGGACWIYLEAYDSRTNVRTTWTPTTAAPSITLAAGTTSFAILGGTFVEGVDYSYNSSTRVLTALAGGALIDAGQKNVNQYNTNFWKTQRGGDWTQFYRALERNGEDLDGQATGPGSTSGGRLLYKNWGYAWLVNRRVLYSNGDTPWDQTDTFTGPDIVARLFTSHNGNVIDYSTLYRKIHRLMDKPYTPSGGDPVGSEYAGRFPWHTEPYETPRLDLAQRWGYNSTRDTAINTVDAGNLILRATDGPTGSKYTGTKIGTPADFPLVLTTIRCVEHFQGGPITRNNWHNVEAEPEPWIEVNSYDARLYGIKDGDMVKVVTARTEDFGNDEIETDFPRALYGDGFRARVGSGLTANQRVGQGVVAIPWHWGDRGLSTGSRANDLTIDAMDANTTIAEYKACLCRIVKY